MKKLFVFVAISLVITTDSFAQIQNGSFETSTGNPSLGHWIYLCGFGNSSSDVPPGGGNWSLEKEAGNTQGCWPAEAYQVLSAVQNGTVLLLKAWVKSDPVVGQTVGIYIGKKGASTFPDKLSGDTTSSKTWMLLSVQDTFTFGIGEQAAVILDPGMVAGPATAKAYFDLVSLEPPITTGMSSSHTDPASRLHIYTSPDGEIIHMEWYSASNDKNIISLFGLDGRLILQHPVSVSLSGMCVYRLSTSTFSPGAYFLTVSMPGKVLKNRILIY